MKVEQEGGASHVKYEVLSFRVRIQGPILIGCVSQ
jgi:hypothetical protein